MEIQTQSDSLDTIRERLRKMSDQELLRCGQASKYMCSPKAKLGKLPRPEFVTQLEEARGEWTRRFPKLPLVDSI
jgi:hypothetical protein